MKNSKLKILVVATLGVLGVMAVKSTETVPQTQTILKSYFQTGSVPTSTNYAELIDTMFYYVAQADSNAVNAANSANAAQSFFLATAKVQLSVAGTNLVATLTNANNIASCSVTNLYLRNNSGHYTYYGQFLITLSNPMPGSNYTAVVSAPASLTGSSFNVYYVTSANGWGLTVTNGESHAQVFYSTNNFAIPFWSAQDLSPMDGQFFKFYIR